MPQIGYLECSFIPGMFPNEFAVTVQSSGTELLSPAEALKVIKDPKNGAPGRGLLRVRVIASTPEGDQLLVDLPQEAFTSTSRLYVPKEAVRENL